MLAPAESLGANAHRVDRVRQTRFHLGQIRVGIGRFEWHEQGFFGQFGHALEIAADADAHNERRARLRPRDAHGLQNEPLHAVLAIGRLEHGEPATILRAKTFGEHVHMHALAGYEPVMDDGGGVVTRIHTAQWIGHHGEAQIALLIALADALVDGIFNRAIGPMHLLAEGKIDDHHASILAQRHALGPRDGGVFEQVGDHTARYGRRLRVVRAR